MTKLVFKDLDLIVYDRNNTYFDVGEVKNIESFAEKLHNKFSSGKVDGKFFYGERKDCFYKALFLGFKRNNKTQWFSFYEDSGDDFNNLFLRAHEQAHIVHAIGKTYALKELVGLYKLKAFDRFWNFWSCDEKERDLVANLAAISVLKKKGHKIMEFELGKIHPEVYPAFSAYLRAAWHDYSTKDLVIRE